MTDLCHNCGDCHLGSHPTSCLKALNECVICKNYGHTFNFCPLSVKRIDKNYQYWMLCHNCDRWHLPRPCDRGLVTCNKCTNIGHLPSFCPVFPDARLRPLGDSAAVNRQRSHSTAFDGKATNSAEMHLATAIERIHPGLLLQIQTQAISSMHPSKALAKQPEWQPREDRSTLLAKQLPPISSLSAVQHNGVNLLMNATLQNQRGTPFGHYHQQQQFPPMMPLIFPTPVPSSAFKETRDVAGEDPFTDNFEEDHMHTPHDPTPIESPEEASAGLSASDTGEKRKVGRMTRTQAKPCATCKKAKKRCSDANATEGEESQTTHPESKKLKLTVENDASCGNAEQTEHMDAIPNQESETGIDVDQRIGDQGPLHFHQGFLPDLNSNADTIMTTQLHGMQEPSGVQAQALPTFGEMMGDNLASGYVADNHLPYSDPPKSFAEGSDAMYRISSDVPSGPRTTGNPEFISAQAESRRRSDIFSFGGSFGDNGQMNRPRDPQQNVDVLLTTESPSGQIHYELPSPMGEEADSIPRETALAAEIKSAAKPKKGASKKKGGSRKQKK